MTSPSDLSQRFLLENLDIRGQVVRLGPLWESILARRDYPGSMHQLLGEFAVLGVLIASGLKHPGRAVLQVMGRGPVTMAVADCTHELALRAMLNSDAKPPLSGEGGAGGEGMTIHDHFPAGRLVLTIENAQTARHFQSIVPLEGATLAECFERYFDRSEQVPTHLWIQATEETVDALILQKLPKADERDPNGWARVQQQAAQNASLSIGTVSAPSGKTANALLSIGAVPAPSGKTANALLSIGAVPVASGNTANAPLSLGRGVGGEGIPELLTALFPEDDVRLFKPQPVKDGCTRSEEKVIAMLRGLGRAEVEATLAEHGVVTVHDEICNQEYRFTAPDVERIFES